MRSECEEPTSPPPGRLCIQWVVRGGNSHIQAATGSTSISGKLFNCLLSSATCEGVEGEMWARALELRKDVKIHDS